MRSPAAAIAWGFRHRHRWGLAAVAFYFAVLVAIRLLVLAPGRGVAFNNDLQFALVVIVPLASTFMYFLAVFSFGLAGDLAARRSIYPRRMFTLPVTSAALTRWPMLYGTMAMVVLWLATRLLALWPVEAEVPWIWPALFAAVILAWTQALTWMPYPLRGLRVVVTVSWLAAIAFVALLALELEARETVMLVLLAPHLPLAFLVARFAVARARSGSLPDWRQVPAAFDLARRRDRGSRPWTSPAGAQLWLEWRRHGRSLPTLVASVLPFELCLFFVFRDTPALVLTALAAVLLTPPVLAAFVAAAVHRSSPKASDDYELTPFIAARPLTSAALIGAKLKATILSTLAAWLLVFAAIPLALGLSDNTAVVVDAAHRVVDFVGMPRAAAIVALGLAFLVVSTLRQLVQNLLLAMSGRAWLVKAYVFLTLLLLGILVPQVPWALRNAREAIATVWNVLPWVLTILAVLKISIACWTAVHLYDRRLLSGRALVLGAFCWTVAVLALYGLLGWLVPTVLVRGYLVVLAATVAVPLVRLAAAPLALAWNRHR